MFKPVAGQRKPGFKAFLPGRKQYKGNLRNDGLERIKHKSSPAPGQEKHAGIIAENVEYRSQISLLIQNGRKRFQKNNGAFEARNSVSGF
jgi:hypothetical protein